MATALFGRKLVTAACALLVFGFIAARPASAQGTFPCVPGLGGTCQITGTAGFETGLQVLAYLRLVKAKNVTVNWGDPNDGMQVAGLLQCPDALHFHECYVFGTHRYSTPGTYSITISYTPCSVGPLGIVFCSSSPTTTSTVAAISPPGNFVILSVGDSVASGEGDPDTQGFLAGNLGINPTRGLWDDPYSDYPNSLGYSLQLTPNPSPCHRSFQDGVAQAVKFLQTYDPITFVHYACSGAKIDASDTPDPNSQNVIDQIRSARTRLPRIDVLLISAGSNSLSGPNSFGNGFSGLVEYCLTHLKNGGCSADAQANADVNTSLKKFPGYYENLAKEINCINPDTDAREPNCTNQQIPKLVLITQYMDPTHDQNGNFPIDNATVFPPVIQCPAIPAPQSEWSWFDSNVVKPLNGTGPVAAVTGGPLVGVDEFPQFALDAGLKVPSYAVTGIQQDFLTHGVCAGAQRWIDTVTDSATLLGLGVHNDLLTNGISGTGHPNSVAFASELHLSGTPCCGQEDYKTRILQALYEFSPPVTMASATVGGKSYTFGTPANAPVTVTLAASNPIGQAGVGRTYYAVDTSQCGSYFAVQGNLENVPGCFVYTGPFTILSGGQHTVTFFTVNSAGYPIVGPFPGSQATPSTTQVITPPLEGILQSVQVSINPGTSSGNALQFNGSGVNLITSVTSLAPFGRICFPFLGCTVLGYTADVNIKNVGEITATNLTVTSAALRGTGALFVFGGGPNLPYGMSSSFNLFFPASAGAEGSRGALIIKEAYNGGTAGGGFRVTLP